MGRSRGGNQTNSNFDKNHYKDFHSVQCTEPTPLALDNFRLFSSNSMNFEVMIESTMGYSFSCKSNQ